MNKIEIYILSVHYSELTAYEYGVIFVFPHSSNTAATFTHIFIGIKNIIRVTAGESEKKHKIKPSY